MCSCRKPSAADFLCIWCFYLNIYLNITLGVSVQENTFKWHNESQILGKGEVTTWQYAEWGSYICSAWPQTRAALSDQSNGWIRTTHLNCKVHCTSPELDTGFTLNSALCPMLMSFVFNTWGISTAWAVIRKKIIRYLRMPLHST